MEEKGGACQSVKGRELQRVKEGKKGTGASEVMVSFLSLETFKVSATRAGGASEKEEEAEEEGSWTNRLPDEQSTLRPGPRPEHEL